MATTKKELMVVTAVATDLVGALIQCGDREGMGFPRHFKPNAAGEWLATIMAIWVGADGQLNILAADPFGNIGKLIMLESHRLVRKAK